MIIEDDFMAKLREEYEGLGLNDSQILSAKSIGLNKEQMKQLIINLRKMVSDFDNMLREVFKAMSPVIKDLSIALNKINKSQTEFIAEPIKNKKDKKLKCWEAKKFYQ